MTYRDDQEGLRARLEEVEAELRLAKEQLAADATAKDWMVGAPLRVLLDRVLPYAVDEDGLERIAELAEFHFPGGSTHLRDGELVHRKGRYELTARRTKDGHTRLRLTGDLTAMRRSLGVLALGPVAFAISLGTIAAAQGVSDAMAMVGVLLGIVLGTLAMRQIVKNMSANMHKSMTTLFDASVAIVEESHEPRQRIEDAEQAESVAAEEAQVLEEQAAKDAQRRA